MERLYLQKSYANSATPIFTVIAREGKQSQPLRTACSSASLSLRSLWLTPRNAYAMTIDISGKDCRDVPWNVSTGVSCHAYLIFGDVYCVINSVSLLNINFCWCKMSGRKLGAIKLITRDSNRGLCLEIS